MGLGYALSEACRARGQHSRDRNAQVAQDHPAASMPPVECILIRPAQPRSVRAKGAGEAVLVPTAAAVAGALRAFDGIRRTRLPMRDSEAARAMVPRLGRGTPAPLAAPRPASAHPVATPGPS
jgi:xanthine dehydrogenase molybdenum-binding subunit